jgi:hypothetical protein
LGLELSRDYIDNFLVVSKDIFDTHLEHLEKVFIRLEGAGSKVNVTISPFYRDKLVHLGYLTNRKLVRPSMKKGHCTYKSVHFAKKITQKAKIMDGYI